MVTPTSESALAGVYLYKQRKNVVNNEAIMEHAKEHLTKLVDLRCDEAATRSEWLEAKEYAAECKKRFEGARQKISSYLKDITEDTMFDKKPAKEKETKVKASEQTELKPVWPFPLPDGMRNLTLDEISKRDDVKSFSATLVGSARDKGFKVAGDVEVFCAGTDKAAKLTDLATLGIKKLLDEVGQRQGTILLNALADVKAKWVEPAKAEAEKPEGWPFPVAAPLCDHSISQVANKFPKSITTPAAGKLVEAGVTTISDLNAKLTDNSDAFLVGIIGPGPTKKLVKAIADYVVADGQ